MVSVLASIHALQLSIYAAPGFQATFSSACSQKTLLSYGATHLFPSVARVLIFFRHVILLRVPIRLALFVKLNPCSEMFEQLGRNFVFVQDAGDDRIRDWRFEVIRVVFDKEIARRTLMELMNEIAKLPAIDIAALPTIERLTQRHKRPSQFLFMSLSRTRSKKPFQALWDLKHKVLVVPIR
jgi:hypothetical protein